MRRVGRAGARRGDVVFLATGIQKRPDEKVTLVRCLSTSGGENWLAETDDGFTVVVRIVDPQAPPPAARVYFASPKRRR
jgi:hypothetical protein